MSRYTPQQVVDHYNELSQKDQRVFHSILKEQQSFKTGLSKLADTINEYGPDAVRLAFLGRTAEAREAAQKYKAEQQNNPNPPKA